MYNRRHKDFWTNLLDKCKRKTGDNMSENCKVFYEGWQMECCGSPFTIGDSISWLVLKDPDLNAPAVDLGKIDYCYEAHSSAWEELFVLTGKVELIDILYQNYERSKENPRYLVPVGGMLVSAENTEDFEEDHDGMKATGYVVTLSGIAVRPARKEEVTFK